MTRAMSIHTEHHLAVPLHVDLIDGRVSIPGRALGPPLYQPNLARLVEGEEAPSHAVLVASLGDTRPVAVAFVREGEGRELDLVQLRLAVKEFEPGLLLPLQVGDGTDFRAVPMPDGHVRYLTRIHLDPGLLGPVLANYEDTAGTWVDLLAEIEGVFRYERPTSLVTQAGTLSFTAGPTLGTPTVVHLPVALEQEGASQDYLLSVTVTASSFGHVLQRAELAESITVTQTGGSFDSQDLAVETAPPHGHRNYLEPTWITRLAATGLSDSGGKLAVTLELDLDGWKNPEDGGQNLGSQVWIARVPCPNWTWPDTDTVATLVLRPGAPNEPVTYAFYDGGDPAFELGRLTVHGNTPLGTGLIPDAVGYSTPLQVVIPRDRSPDHLELVWAITPTVAGGVVPQAVDIADTGNPPAYSIEARPWPTPSDFFCRVDLLGILPGGAVTDTITSQEFVIRCRRELIPTTLPPVSS